MPTAFATRPLQSGSPSSRYRLYASSKRRFSSADQGPLRMWTCVDVRCRADADGSRTNDVFRSGAARKLTAQGAETGGNWLAYVIDRIVGI